MRTLKVGRWNLGRPKRRWGGKGTVKREIGKHLLLRTERLMVEQCGEETCPPMSQGVKALDKRENVLTTDCLHFFYFG